MIFRQLLGGCLSLLVITMALPVRADEKEKPSAKAVINKYCITCHSANLKTAGLQLDGAEIEQIGARADLWEKVASKFRTGEMPPAGMPRPDKATYANVTAELETALDAAALDGLWNEVKTAE